MALRNLLTRWTEPELAAFDRLENAFGELTIVDDNSDGPYLSAVAAYELLGGDTDPQRVRLIVAQVRNRKERKALLRQLGADSLNHGPRAA